MKIYHIVYKPNIKLRIIATLIDYGIYLIFFWVYVNSMGTETEPGVTRVDGLPALPIFLIWFLYFVGLEAWNGATPGHDICGLRVIRVGGDKLGLWDAFKRRILDFIDIGLYGIIALICISKTAKHQRLGDLLADTAVIKKSDIIEEVITF